MKSRTLHVTIALLFLSIPAATQLLSQNPQPDSTTGAPYRNTSLPVDQRVADLLHRMTLEEKATMLAGSGWMESASIPRLGIPGIKMADGPLGVRSWMGSSAITNSATAPKILSLIHI